MANNYDEYEYDDNERDTGRNISTLAKKNRYFITYCICNYHHIIFNKRL